MRAAYGLLLGLSLLGSAGSDKPSIDELEGIDPFEDGDDDFDDNDDGYGRQAGANPTTVTTGVKRELPEGVQPGTILFEVCTG
jgi:hypothetical protein